MIWLAQLVASQVAKQPALQTPGVPGLGDLVTVIYAALGIGSLTLVDKAVFWVTKIRQFRAGANADNAAGGDISRADLQKFRDDARDTSAVVSRLATATDRIVDIELEEHRVIQLELQSIRETCTRIEHKLERP